MNDPADFENEEKQADGQVGYGVQPDGDVEFGAFELVLANAENAKRDEGDAHPDAGDEEVFEHVVVFREPADKCI